MDVKTIYEPNKRGKLGWVKTWLVLTNNIIANRDLIIQLFKRDFLMQYKKSFLGMSWLIISPIMGIISWVFMNATGVLQPGDVGIPYPAYVLISSSIFGLFMNFYTGASGTLTAGAGFIMQVSFPHDVLLVKQLLQQLAGFLITFLITITVLLYFGVVPSLTIVLFPILIIPIILLGSSIGLISSIVNVVAVDIQKLIAFAVSLLMYVTPVIYSDKVQNEFLQSIIKWNPLTYLLGTVRDSIIYGTFENFDKYCIAATISIAVFLVSWRLFYIAEEKVIEKMI